MKKLYSLFITLFLASCGRDEESKKPVVLRIEATSQRHSQPGILRNIGGQVIQIQEGQCRLRFELIKSGKIKSLGNAKFDSSLGKVAYITPAVLEGGKCVIDAYIPGNKITKTENSYSQEPSLKFLTYEFITPNHFGTSRMYKSTRIEATTLLLAYIIVHQDNARLKSGVDESIDAMLLRSQKGDVSFLAIVAEPME